MKSLALRLLGHRFDTRFLWGEIAWHPRYWKVGFRVCRAADSEDKNMLIASFLLLGFYIYLPTSSYVREGRGGNGYAPEFGFYTIGNSIVWRWGRGYYSWDWPFVTLKHFKTEVLSLTGESIYTEPKGKFAWEEKKAFSEANSETHDYAYVLKNGKIQHRKATIHVERWTWRRKWAPLLKYVRTSIEISFNEEVGERAGSWKGGCTGCSYEMKKGETPLQTLRRMESERIFD